MGAGCALAFLFFFGPLSHWLREKGLALFSAVYNVYLVICRKVT